MAVVVVAHAVLPTGGTSAWKIDMADSSCCTNCPLIAVASSSSMLEAAARLVLERSIPSVKALPKLEATLVSDRKITNAGAAFRNL